MSTVEGLSFNGGSKEISQKNNPTMMKDDFLKLLVTQLQHQDPLNPMEGMEFTSQLSRFAQLEQMFQINSQLGDLNLYQASLNNMHATDLIGREVKALGDVLHLEEGGVLPFTYRLEKSAVSVNVNIVDEEGHVVRSYAMGSRDEGTHEIQWDGRDGEGNSVPDGDYHFEVNAKGPDGDPVRVSAFIQGTVTGLTFENARPLLYIGSNKIPVGEVFEVLETGGKE